MPHNFSRPKLPYSNQSLPNDNRYQAITNPLKAPPTDKMLDTDFNYLIDAVNTLDQDIINVVAGNIPGSSTPANANHVLITDGAGNLSFVFVSGQNVSDASIPGTKLIASSVTSNEIGDGSITSAKISPNSVNSTHLADNSVTTNKINDGAIETNKYADISITAEKIANKTITSAEIADQGIFFANMANDSVGTNQLILGSVTFQKLAQSVLDVLVPIGSIIEFAGTTGVSTSFLECNGQAVSRTTYSTLFANIGTTYGNGDGSTTFNLPDRRGRTAVGIGSDNSTNGLITNATAAQIALGKTFGEETHILTTAEMPSHTHPIPAYNNGGSSGHLSQDSIGAFIQNLNTNSTGGDQPHNNTQPSIFMRFYIRAL